MLSYVSLMYRLCIAYVSHTRELYTQVPHCHLIRLFFDARQCRALYSLQAHTQPQIYKLIMVD